MASSGVVVEGTGGKDQGRGKVLNLGIHSLFDSEGDYLPRETREKMIDLVVYPINGTMFGNDYPQQNKLSKCSLKYSVISVVHH